MADDAPNVFTSVRLMQLEQRVEELERRIGNLVDQVALLNRALKARLDDEHSLRLESNTEVAGPSAIGEAISPGMFQVIELIQRGESDAAQQALYSLPENELAMQPAAVALVAAALFVQRGDVEAGLRALKQARQLTSDPRLLALVGRLEQQVG